MTDLSPLQLACFTLGISLLGGTVFLLPLAPGSPHRSLWLVLGLILFIVGMLLPFKVKTELESGIANHRWSGSQVQKARASLNSPVTTIIMIAFAIAYLSLAFQHGVARHYAYCFYMPVLAIGQLVAAVKEPGPTASIQSIDWTSAQPLRSEHWGER